MSLKAQLRISIVTLVTMLVLMQCVATLRFTIEDKFNEVQERAEAIKEQTRLQVQQRVNDQVARKPPPANFEEAKKLVYEVVANDPFLPEMFITAIVSSRSVVEIQLCDEQGVILTSSAKHQSRQTYVSLPMFEDWRKTPLWDRVWELMSNTRDYAMVVPLAPSGDATKRVLDVRIVISTALIRDAIENQVKTLAAFSALSLLAAMALAYFFSNVLVNWLNRISRRIESIATGEFTPSDKTAHSKEPKEFADMSYKLEVLGQQFRGAREDMIELRSNIDGMLERLEEGVILFDANRKVVRASRSAERILSLSQAQVIGKPLEELFPASTPLGELLRDVIMRPRTVREAAVTLERGEAGPLRLLANVDLVGGPAHNSSLLLTLRDIESRRQIRTQLDISTRLAAISRLTGGAAHEIKNPLNAMAIHLQNLSDKLAGETRVQGELTVIGGEIARLDKVVKTFLEFTRPVELQIEQTDVVELAREVAALIWPGAERDAVSVELESKVQHAWARVDRDLIKQALINVVNNGVEAMDKGGRLTICVDREGDQILVTVADQGPGIPPEIRDKIFDLYFTTKKGVGSGIGLARTFQIVQMHNGTVDFSSNPFSGTTFRLRFPAAEDLSTSEPGVAGATLGNSSASSGDSAVKDARREAVGH
jgi:signal transduction histidine kinase